MNKSDVIKAAKKTFVALKNPYKSIDKVFVDAIDIFDKDFEEVYYVGVKNRQQIPLSLIKKIKKSGFALHTLDVASNGGRAVDMYLTNPISGKHMTGSSSGTAINVLTGINDLGIGTDGGGSVLGPAMSVNCFGFISKCIESEYVSRFSNTSTDKIVFSPSIGFITRDYPTMIKAVNTCIELRREDELVKVLTDGKILKDDNRSYQVTDIEFPKLRGNRSGLIDLLLSYLSEYDVVITKEGPIDFEGLGDTVLGHFDEMTKANQEKGNKEFIKVINMVNASSIVVPTSEFATAYVLICKSDVQSIHKMLEVAEQLICKRDDLIERYFQKIENYYPKEFCFNDGE